MSRGHNLIRPINPLTPLPLAFSTGASSGGVVLLVGSSTPLLAGAAVSLPPAVLLCPDSSSSSAVTYPLSSDSLSPPGAVKAFKLDFLDP
jgi:hypothetical protein